MKQANGGFGLIELLAVLALAALLLGLGARAWQHYRADAAEAALQSVLWRMISDIQTENLLRPSEKWDNGRLAALVAVYRAEAPDYALSAQWADGRVYLLALPEKTGADAVWGEADSGLYRCPSAADALSYSETACRRF